MFESEISQWAMPVVLTALGGITSVRVATTWGQNQEKEREIRERSDIRSNDRQERDSIRKNFGLQRARMPKMGTTELIAFSQAAAAEVKKRQSHMDELEYLENELRRLRDQMAIPQTQEFHIEPSRRGLQDDGSGVMQGWEQEPRGSRCSVRSDSVNGGFTSHERYFRELARTREGMDTQQRVPVVDAACANSTRAEDAGAPVVHNSPGAALRAANVARQQHIPEARTVENSASHPEDRLRGNH